MKYNLCSACIHFRPELVSFTKRIPRHCASPFLCDFAGEKVGFISGIDVVHCAYFVQHSPYSGDVLLVTPPYNADGLSYIISLDHKNPDGSFRSIGEVNQSIKIIHYDTTEKIAGNTARKSRPSKMVEMAPDYHSNLDFNH